jgi:DNA-binding NarL/FixJ family response regulator
VVVDDSIPWLEALCGFLRSHPGIAVVGTAPDGVEGLSLIHRLQPELVVLDVQMPRMNGIDTAAVISRRLPETRIVMMSLNDDTVTRERCGASGAHAFLPKSTTPDSVLEEIFRICDRTRPQLSNL